ncbi:MAG: hypothetical protein ACE5H4_03660 [Candidatus Thorarchaeota archaeon]
MRIGEIDVVPIAAESIGVRSLCTKVSTPDITIMLDPSAALAMRGGLEPHPQEYRALMKSLERIFVEARNSDILSVSHYHYDHVRPGFTDFRYNLSSREELQRIFEDKLVFAKDNREHVNASQRKRGFYFERDTKGVVEEIRWSDGKAYSFGETNVLHSHPLPHGPVDTSLGYVIATTIEHSDTRILFAPDVQGPLVKDTLEYMLSQNSDVAIVGGPPMYLNRFRKSQKQSALSSLKLLASRVSLLIVDHHLMRSDNWEAWLYPVMAEASKTGNELKTMAEIAGVEVSCLEAKRKELYSMHPPGAEFMNWVKATDEYKSGNLPPMDRPDTTD